MKGLHTQTNTLRREDRGLRAKPSAWGGVGQETFLRRARLYHTLSSRRNNESLWGACIPKGNTSVVGANNEAEVNKTVSSMSSIAHRSYTIYKIGGRSLIGILPNGSLRSSRHPRDLVREKELVDCKRFDVEDTNLGEGGDIERENSAQRRHFLLREGKGRHPGMTSYRAQGG